MHALPFSQPPAHARTQYLICLAPTNVFWSELFPKEEGKEKARETSRKRGREGERQALEGSKI